MDRASERPMVSTADMSVALPRDVVMEILLRVPARQLCRFRAVCRSWHCLLSDPSFFKAHAALRPALILALAADGNRIDVVDLSGNVVKQMHVPAAEEKSVLPAHPGPAFLFRANNRVRMVDPDTGAVFTLPFDDHDNPTSQQSYYSTTRTEHVLGRDTSTGNHKVLRIVTRVITPSRGSLPFQQLCHVLTLGGDDDNRPMQCWRESPRPQISIKSNVLDSPGVTIQGLVYFLASKFFTAYDIIHPDDAQSDKWIKFLVSFDLEKEQWRPTTLQVPAEINTGSGVCQIIKLVKLSNTLAVVDSYYSNISLWFAEDLEKGLWVKKHCIDQELLAPTTSVEREYPISMQKKVRLLMELDDDRIIFSYYMPLREASHWRTRVYDPRTKACTDLPQLDLCDIIGVYIETLLYLVKW